MNPADSLANEQAVLAAWTANADAWISAVRSGAIQTRARVTDAAVLTAIRGLHPRTVLDVGCGEGWLCRALIAEGIEAIGVDAVDALIEAARSHGDGEYHCLSYQDLAHGLLDIRVDLAVCNFSLFGERTVETLLSAIPLMLRPGGALVIQTLHQDAIGSVLPREDGWREGNWAGCGSGFSKPAPWFFRTNISWRRLLLQSGFSRVETKEPTDSESGLPVSFILIGRLGR